MFMERQGVNLHPKVKELENRIEVLENVVKALQLQPRAKLGRPPKDAHGNERLEVGNTGRD
jgi:hypothetical protein